MPCRNIECLSLGLLSLASFAALLHALTTLSAVHVVTSYAKQSLVLLVAKFPKICPVIYVGSVLLVKCHVALVFTLGERLTMRATQDMQASKMKALATWHAEL